MEVQERINLFDYVHAAFEANGVIVGLGGRFVAEQYEYAMVVSQALMQQGEELAVSALEAETGVGKSLGYLIPSLIYVSLYDVSNQIVISTFTRLLQKQIMGSDLIFAEQVMRELGLVMPKISYRMGRQAFFSLERTQSTVERLKQQYSGNEQYIQELDQFYSFARSSCKDGTGSWLDWIDEYYVLPNHIHSNDICLLYNAKIDNDAYIKHINDSSSAKILLTNHSTLIGHENISDFVDACHIVIADECHHLDRLMAERSNKQLPIKTLAYLFSRASIFGIKGNYLADARNFLKHWSEHISDFDTAQGSLSHFYLSTGAYKQWINDQVDHVKQIQTWLRRIEKEIDKYQKTNDMRVTHIEFYEKLQYALITLSHWSVTNSLFHRALVFEDQSRSCSFAVVNPIASRLFANTIRKLTDRLILTSATLSDAKKDERSISIIGDLGFSKVEVDRVQHFTPKHYGNMQFVLASREIPVPTSFDKELGKNRFSEAWLNYTAKMILEAQKTGPTLVLTYSFEETKMLQDRLSLLKPDLSLVVHEKGKKLLECVPVFLQANQGVLMTPAGWDGLNLRSVTKTQYIQNLVITRIPNPPKNDLQDYVAKEYMLAKDMPLHIVENILWLKYINFCFRVMRQGLGRGIRSPQDRILVWIADPRMPTYDSPKARPMIYTIPERFLANYAKAMIFEFNGSLSTGKDELEIVL
jgi:ATP-dependent DNA helicase DinG